MSTSNQNTNRIGRFFSSAARVIASAIAGAALGAAFYKLSLQNGIYKSAILGTFVGLLVGIVFPLLRQIWSHMRSGDWRVDEVEVGIPGGSWKIANNNSQRRIAWIIFVELVTRVATQPKIDEEGDDGATLKSLYELFACTRKYITEVEPFRGNFMPTATKDTAETFALVMLNQDLRPFLSKWHPLWDSWSQENNDPCLNWPHHLEFQAALRELQIKLMVRAEGLAKIAGVEQPSRFLAKNDS